VYFDWVSASAKAITGLLNERKARGRHFHDMVVVEYEGGRGVGHRGVSEVGLWGVSHTN
jgi:hypothetical protein